MICDYCEADIAGEPVRDEHRVFCGDDCQEAASERYWLNVWAAR